MPASYFDACQYAAQRSLAVKRSMAVLAPLDELDPDGEGGFDVLGWEIALRHDSIAEHIVAVYDHGVRMVS